MFYPGENCFLLVAGGEPFWDPLILCFAPTVVLWFDAGTQSHLSTWRCHSLFEVQKEQYMDLLISFSGEYKDDITRPTCYTSDRFTSSSYIVKPVSFFLSPSLSIPSLPFFTLCHLLLWYTLFPSSLCYWLCNGLGYDEVTHILILPHLPHPVVSSHTYGFLVNLNQYILFLGEGMFQCYRCRGDTTCLYYFTTLLYQEPPVLSNKPRALLHPIVVISDLHLHKLPFYIIFGCTNFLVQVYLLVAEVSNHFDMLTANPEVWRTLNHLWTMEIYWLPENCIRFTYWEDSKSLAPLLEALQYGGSSFILLEVCNLLGVLKLNPLQSGYFVSSRMWLYLAACLFVKPPLLVKWKLDYLVFFMGSYKPP